MHTTNIALAAALLLASPSVALSTSGKGLGDWAPAYSKAKTALAKLSLQEKVGLVTGVKWQGGPCVGNTSPASKIGYPSLCLQDSPLGIRFVNHSTTAWPAGIQVGSTWDKDLMRARGVGMGAEAKGVGVNVQLGPVAGPLGKIAQAGRNWEGFANDPYLSGIAMQETIEGMQSSGVQACAKHFILNEQEKNRETMSSDVNDRALHELYVWPFADAIHSGAASVMCSYNKVNESWACESEHVMSVLLKDQLNFQGYVVSDWNAQHSTVNSANSGLDMTMPGSDFNQPPGSIYWGANLISAVKSGQVPQRRLDDMVTRILASWYKLKQDQGYPAVSFNSFNGGNGAPDVKANHASLARQIAADGVVLLKNTNHALPLQKPKSVALVGQDAIVNPAGPNACSDRGCNTGHLAMGWGSGTAEFPYLIAPYDAINAQSKKDGTKVFLSGTDDLTAGAAAAAKAERALVFITSDSGEGYITVEGNAGDRNNLDPWHNGNALVAAVAKKNKNTIVVVNSVGPIILESILAQPNVTAVVWAGIAGQESGNGLADILYGRKSPSGKLPYTIAKKTSDYNTAVVPGTDTFQEGLYIDYRHFDKAGITPRYEFGYGLSYSTFGYSELKAAKRTVKYNTSPVPGGKQGDFDSVASVQATITNTGKVAAAEVAQLYIGLPDSAPETPAKQLRGFQKILLNPGQSKVVTFNLRRRDLSYWDVKSQSWLLPAGKFKVYVGSSSRKIKLTGTM